MNKQIQQSGKKLNVSGQDIKKIHKGCFERKLLHVVVSVLLAILTFILGLIVGKKMCSQESTPHGYPYSGAGENLMFGGLLASKKKNSRLVALLVSAIAFLSSVVANPVFGEAIKYNVYTKDS